jgi:hypothetical protein
VLTLALELRQALGVVPAIIFPVASLVQLVALIRSRSGRGISVLTWSLFILANLCLFMYMENRGELQAIATTMLTAVIQTVIVALAIKWRHR